MIALFFNVTLLLLLLATKFTAFGIQDGDSSNLGFGKYSSSGYKNYSADPTSTDTKAEAGCSCTAGALDQLLMEKPCVDPVENGCGQRPCNINIEIQNPSQSPPNNKVRVSLNGSGAMCKTSGGACDTGAGCSFQLILSGSPPSIVSGTCYACTCKGKVSDNAEGALSLVRGIDVSLSSCQ